MVLTCTRDKIIASSAASALMIWPNKTPKIYPIKKDGVTKGFNWIIHIIFSNKPTCVSMSSSKCGSKFFIISVSEYVSIISSKYIIRANHFNTL